MKRLIMILILAAVIISGCELADKIPKSLPGLEPSKGDESLLGSSGEITMNIIYPTEGGSIIRDIEFSPRIEVMNTGSANADGQVCISGIGSETFTSFSGCECLNYQYHKVPDETFEPETLIFGPYGLEVAQDLSTDFVMTSINRYEYTSKAIFKPKISKDLASSGIDIQETANGPLAIQSIKQEVVPTQGDAIVLAYKVELKNTGRGKVIPATYLREECAVDDIGSIERRKTHVRVTAGIENFPTIGSVPCKEAYVNDKGEASLTCVIGQVSMTDEYGNYIFTESVQTPSTLIVNYAYEQRDSNKFSIGSELMV